MIGHSKLTSWVLCSLEIIYSVEDYKFQMPNDKVVMPDYKNCNVWLSTIWAASDCTLMQIRLRSLHADSYKSATIQNELLQEPAGNSFEFIIDRKLSSGFNRFPVFGLVILGFQTIHTWFTAVQPEVLQIIANNSSYTCIQFRVTAMTD